MGVKKAVTLSSIEELNMSARTKKYLNNAYSSLQEIIWYGRHTAYLFSEGLRKREKSNKSTRELVDAFYEAGYIRSDINANSFSVGRLYRSIYKDVADNKIMPRGIDDFCSAYWKKDGKNIMYFVDYEQANRNYEEFKNPSANLIKQVDMALKLSLDELEYAILAYRYGFEDDKMHSLAQVARVHHVTSERIHQIESRAFRKLKAKKYLDLPEYTGIESLDLSPRAYNCLKRAGIDTVADIINLPERGWRTIRYLGRKTMDEIITKTRQAGYTDFDVRIHLS